MTTMQRKILGSMKCSKADRDAVRRRRDRALLAAVRGEPVERLEENAFYVLKPDGQSVQVPYPEK